LLRSVIAEKERVSEVLSLGNQGASTAARPPLGGTLRLSDSDWLTETIDRCQNRPVAPDTGLDEFAVGSPRVIVNGIIEDGKKAHVDFEWVFSSVSAVGKSLGLGEDLSQFGSKTFHGTAQMVEYDDGWRIVALKLTGWDYGPEWPDPEFNWGAFDEDENVYDVLR